MSYQKPSKTSELCVPEKKVSATKEVHSTESFQDSCAKEAISPDKTEPAENPSTAKNSLTITSSENTFDQVSCPWPTADQTPTVASSLSQPLLLLGWTVNTSFLARSPKVWM